MKIFNTNNETNIQNKLLNSILKIIYLENNMNINVCELLFDNLSVYNNQEIYRHITSLNYMRILFKFDKVIKNAHLRKIMLDILSKFTFDEMENCLDMINKNLFSNYKSIDSFFDLMEEKFQSLKKYEFLINKKLYEIMNCLLNIEKYNKEELLNKNNFRKMIFKIFFFLLNTEGPYNPKNDIMTFDTIKTILETINENIFVIEIFKIFFIECYDFEIDDKKNEIILKYHFLTNCKDYKNFYCLKIKELDSSLFNYFENIISLFTSFTPNIEIINYLINYFKFVYYYFFEIFQKNEFLSNLKENENYFFLCNFSHFCQSKKIIYAFYIYIIKYLKNSSKTKIVEILGDLNNKLINSLNLFPYPFYLKIIYDYLKNVDKYKEYELYINELIEMVLDELFGRDKDSKFDENKYKNKNYLFNIIQLVIIFFCISKDSNSCKIFNNYKLKEYWFILLSNLKKHKFIFSQYLINLENDKIKEQKTILEICFITTIIILNSGNDINKDNNDDINNKFYELFLNKDLEKYDNYGKSVIFTFDIFNCSLNSKEGINSKIKIDDYSNKNLEEYLVSEQCQKEEKSLLIDFIIYLYKIKTLSIEEKENNNNLSINYNYNKLIIEKFLNLLIDDLLTLIDNSAIFKKLKIDSIYNLFVDNINNYKKKENNISKENLILLIDEIKNILKLNNDINYLNLLENKGTLIGKCLLEDNCLLKAKIIEKEFKEFNKVESPIISNSYFDIEMINVVKCLKRDLLLKDCSIYFNDIYFNDNNFRKIKNSFFYNYNQYLVDNDDVQKKQLLNYPSRLKNFSSNKYATPKIFFSCNINLYKNEYFSLLYPKINKNLLKNNSFPSLPSHYNNYNNLLMNSNDKILSSFNCELIAIKNTIYGQMDLYEKFIVFKNKDSLPDYKNDASFIYSSGNEAVINKKIIIIEYNQIEEIINRTFAYIWQAIEIFLKNGKSYFFNLLEEYYLNDFYNIIENKIKIDLKITKEPEKIFEKLEFTKNWENNNINNYQYLLYLNKYSGRTFNDFNQYPIFPWLILTQKYKDTNDNNETNIYFRNMKYFMSAQTENGREKAIENYTTSEEDSPKNPLHFRIHYSTGGFILLYLMRTPPFMDMHIKFQSGQFDSPNRMINNIEEILNIIKETNDNRELIPEYFTSMEYLCNLNYIYFGRRNDGKIVNNIGIPSLFNSKGEFIYYNRLFLNNRIKNKISFPNCELYDWINIVFGYYQYPPSLQYLNKFEKYSYRQCVSLEKSYEKLNEKFKKKVIIKRDEIIKRISTKRSRIINFGQCPQQLFKYKLNDFKSDFFNYNFHSNTFFDFTNEKLTTIITFWLSENQTYIYFLIKYKEKKNMSILIYDDKYTKKYEVIIDKIKLFNCKNDYNIIKKEKEKRNNEINDKERSSLRREFAKTKNYWKNMINNNQNKDNFIFNDLSELYILNPKDAIIDIYDYYNIYFFVGRNKDNSIRIYTQYKNGRELFGLLKTDSFISVIYKKSNECFLTGHSNGKIIEWETIYKDIVKTNSKLTPNKNAQKKMISDIILKREIIAHDYRMITSINYNERYNIILTSDTKGFLFIRKYYDFELITKIQINNNDSCFINKIFLNDYDIICTINYNRIKFKNYITFYSINGILLEQSENYMIINSSVLKNGKIIFNRFNKDIFFIFGFNGNKSDDKALGQIKDENIFENLDTKIDSEDSIYNFIIENNIIYILSKKGKFIKAYFGKLDTLSFGEYKFN